MSDLSNKYVKFEEDNFVDLAEKFVRLPAIETKWIDFVDEEYIKSHQEPDFDGDCDDSAQL
jgi:hypothetical protein